MQSNQTTVDANTQAVTSVHELLSPEGNAQELLVFERQQRVAGYDGWIGRFDKLGTEDVELIRAHVATIDLRTPFIVIRFDSRTEANLQTSLQGLQRQILEKWRAELYFDSNCSAESVALAKMYADADSRLSVRTSAGADTALDGPTVTSVLILCGGVVLREHALYMFALAAANRQTALVYSDEDSLGATGERFAPIFKPAFSPELFRNKSYFGNCVLLRGSPDILRELIHNFGLNHQDLEPLVDNFLSYMEPRNVIHVSHTLFHDSIRSRPGRSLKRPCSLQDALPSVSIIIPTRDRADLLRQCLESIQSKTEYRKDRFEIVVIDNGSREDEAIRLLETSAASGAIHLVRDSASFNFSRLNNGAAAECRNDILVFLNNDTVIIDSLWLHRLVDFASRDDVGVVGCKLLYPDGTVQHGGVAVGIQSSAVHCHVGIGRDDPGFQGLASVTREISAVTAACMAIRRDLFEKLGRFDEELAINFNDTDLCLRAIRRGYRNIYIGDALAIHHESTTRGPEDTLEKVIAARREAEIVRMRHMEFFRNDPCYSPNLSIDRLYELAFPPRRTKPWREYARHQGRLKILFVCTRHGSTHHVSRIVNAQATDIASLGYEVFVGGPKSDSEHVYAGCRRVELDSPEDAAIFAVQNDIDCIITHEWPFFKLARWVGEWPKVICCNHGLPREISNHERERIEVERRVCFSMSHRVVGAPAETNAGSLETIQYVKALKSAIDAVCRSQALRCPETIIPETSRPTSEYQFVADTTGGIVARGNLDAKREAAGPQQFYIKLRALDGSELVDQAYLAILGRYADPSGRAHYVGRLSEGVARDQIIWEIASSEEARALGVRACDVMTAAGFSRYEKKLARKPWNLSGILEKARVVGPIGGRIRSLTEPPRSDGDHKRSTRNSRTLSSILAKVRLGRTASARIRLLAESSLLDPAYVCKQMGIPICDAAQAARIYYDGQKLRRIRPNPLFEPEYYRHINGLEYSVDPVEHYLREGAAKHLPCHRLFDGEWYKSRISGAASAPDLLAHYWSVGYPARILPVNPQTIAVLPEISEMFFVDTESADFGAFHAGVYRSQNPDLRDMDDDALRNHYENHGGAEGRIASMRQFFELTQASPRFVPVDFNPKDYADVYLDLADGLKDNWAAYLPHYLTHGLSEERFYNLGDIFSAPKLNNQTFSVDAIHALEDKTPLCVLMHLYYPEMWSELNEYLDKIEVPFDLYVNLVDTTWTADILEKIRADRPQARVHISANAGRDIGGYIRLLDVIDCDRYVAFATLHSKKSPHVTPAYAKRWRTNLLDGVLGSKHVASQNIAAFVESPKVGIVASGHHRSTTLGENKELFERFLDLYEIEEQCRQCEYVSGTMMMVRAEIMKRVYAPLRDYDFKSGDNKDLSFYIDGQAEHAVERIFGNVMKQLGYEFLWR